MPEEFLGGSPDYPITHQLPIAEREYRDYEYETWAEDPSRWSPCIDLAQLEKRPDLEVEWYVPDFCPVGAKTIISAEPKTGKTILLFHMLKALTNGEDFLGKPCPPTRCVFLTEQTEHEFKRQVCEVPGLIGNPNFYVLLAEDTPETVKTWEDVIDFSERMLSITKSKVLVIDTFSGLAKLPPNGENDAATVQNHANKLNKLFRNRYLSVIMTHHNRKKSTDWRNKSGDLDISSARGSSAFVGAAGHLLFMDAPDGVLNCRRRIVTYGRYMNEDVKSLYLINGQYFNTQYPQAGRR